MNPKHNDENQINHCPNLDGGPSGCPCLNRPNLTHMKMKINSSNHNSRLFLLTAVLLAIGATARSADIPTLKDAYKNHFYVGVAINRTIATGTAVQADNVNRTQEQV